MILRKIELNSFRQFREAEIVFDLGTTAIIGTNGSGKTTILEALKFALYGDCRGKKPEIANMHHGGKTSAAVEFELNGTRYRCERNLNDAAMYRVELETSAKLAYSLTGVSDFTEKLLGLTAEQFCNSYMTEQKEVEFLKFAKARQQEQIAQMLGIEVLAIAAKKAKDVQRASALALGEIQSMLDDKGALEADLRTKEAAAETKAGELAYAKKGVLEGEKKIEALAPQNDLATELLELVARTKNREDVGRTLKDEAAALKQELAIREAEAAEFSELEPAAKQYASASEKHSEMLKLRGRLSERERLITLREARQESLEELEKSSDPNAPGAAIKALESLEAALKARIDKQKALDHALAAWRESQRTLLSAMDSLRSDHARYSAELLEVLAAEAKGICPTCGQRMPDSHVPRSISLQADIMRIAAEIDENERLASAQAIEPDVVALAKANVDKSTLACDEANRGHLAAEHASKQHTIAEGRIKTLQKEIEEIGASIASLPTSFDQAAFDTLSQEMVVLEPRYKRYIQLSSAPQAAADAKARYEAKARQFEDERAKQELDKNRIAEIGMDATKAREIQAEFSTAQSSLPHLKHREDASAEALAIAKVAVEEAKARIAKWHENAERIEKHRHDRDLYGSVGDAMTEMRSHLNSLIRPTLATFAGEALGIITDNRYTRVDIDQSFNATLYDGDHRKNVISGGEEDVLALALRIALSRYVQEKSGHALSLLVLDEVFGSLDSDRRMNVLEWLNGLKAMFPQIIWISHVDGLTEHADRVLRVRFDEQKKESTVEEYYSEQLSL